MHLADASRGLYSGVSSVHVCLCQHAGLFLRTSFHCLPPFDFSLSPNMWSTHYFRLSRDIQAQSNSFLPVGTQCFVVSSSRVRSSSVRLRDDPTGSAPNAVSSHCHPFHSLCSSFATAPLSTCPTLSSLRVCPASLQVVRVPRPGVSGPSGAARQAAAGGAAPRPAGQIFARQTAVA